MSSPETFVYLEAIIDHLLAELMKPSQTPSFISEMRVLFLQLTNVLRYYKSVVILYRQRHLYVYHNKLLVLIINVLQNLITRLNIEHRIYMLPLLESLSSFHVI